MGDFTNYFYGLHSHHWSLIVLLSVIYIRGKQEGDKEEKLRKGRN